MAPKPLSSLSIFFPVYRDENTVEPLTKACLKIGHELTDDLEILIIDDHSPDKAGEIAERLARENTEVRVIHHPVNRGIGQAMIQGFTQAKKDYVFYTDGDFQYDVKELSLLVPHAAIHDLVVGFRLKRAEGFKRVFTSRCFHAIIFLLFGIHYRDIDCSFKLVRRRFLDKIIFRSQSALVDFELLMNAKRLGIPVKEVGVHHFARRFGESQCLRANLVLSMLRDTLRLRWLYR